MDFMQALRERWTGANTLVCVGLDPEPAKFPAHLRERSGRGVRILPRHRRRHRGPGLLLQAADRPLRRARAPSMTLQRLIRHIHESIRACR